MESIDTMRYAVRQMKAVCSDSLTAVAAVVVGSDVCIERSRSTPAAFGTKTSRPNPSISRVG
jgi:hypothetical protein